VRTGRMKDRDFGRGLPLVTVREILSKLQGNKPFTVELKASNIAGISGDPNNTLPQYLIGLIAAAVRPLYALEIGTGSGGATCQIAAQLREGGSVVTIDTPLEWSNPLVRPAHAELSELGRIMRSTAGNKRFAWHGSPLEIRIELIRADSRTMDYTSLGRKFDLVFIDASHTENAVRRDTECVLPFLADEAVILWHDYESSNLSHGVDKYLDELSRSSEWPIHIIEYTTLAIQIRR